MITVSRGPLHRVRDTYVYAKMSAFNFDVRSNIRIVDTLEDVHPKFDQDILAKQGSSDVRLRSRHKRQR